MTVINGTKYFWKLPEFEAETVLEFARSYNLSYSIVQTLLNRGYKTKDDFENYLFTSFDKVVYHPSLLKDAQKVVDRILRAIKSREKILVCGDYDVDGITSSAMMMICLLPLGAHVNYFLPHRVKDGYGLSSKTVKKAAKNNYKILITVDNGITAFEAAYEAKKAGIDLIITDHHKPYDTLPEAYAIVNPHQKECPYPFKKFAGVGVIFKVLSLLYECINKKLPNKAYELLLLGTIADVVPLVEENRFWVRYGLNLVNNNESLSVKVLKHNAGFTKPDLNSLDIGFFLTPQINALGRLEDARQGVRFLVGADSKEVVHVGKVLKELNEARKCIERKIFDQIELLLEQKKIDINNERIILAYSTDWQPGVIGLVASRVVSAYNRPVLLFHITEEGIAKGSCRSIPEFNIFEALNDNKDILISFGGHAQAAGLSLHLDKLNELKDRLENTITQIIPQMPLKASIQLDAMLSLSEVNKKLIDDISYMEPFGNENGQPIFYLRNVNIIGTPMLLKDNHTKFMVFSDGVLKPVIFFNRPEIYNILMSKKLESVSLAVYVTQNYFNGQMSVELQGIDIAYDYNY